MIAQSFCCAKSLFGLSVILKKDPQTLTLALEQLVRKKYLQKAQQLRRNVQRLRWLRCLKQNFIKKMGREIFCKILFAPPIFLWTKSGLFRSLPKIFDRFGVKMIRINKKMHYSLATVIFFSVLAVFCQSSTVNFWDCGVHIFGSAASAWKPFSKNFWMSFRLAL